MHKTTIGSLAATLVFATTAWAEFVEVKVHRVSSAGVGEQLGTVVFKEIDHSKNKTRETPESRLSVQIDLKGIPPGAHGFHLHQHANCEPAFKEGKLSAAESAGPHFDPSATNAHRGPHGDGHLGDLPVLTAAADGTVKSSFVATRLVLADIRGRSIIIHEHGDNYSDTPKPLGGGGARIACGIVP